MKGTYLRSDLLRANSSEAMKDCAVSLKEC